MHTQHEFYLFLVVEQSLDRHVQVSLGQFELLDVLQHVGKPEIKESLQLRSKLLHARVCRRLAL